MAQAAKYPFHQNVLKSSDVIVSVTNQNPYCVEQSVWNMFELYVSH